VPPAPAAHAGEDTAAPAPPPPRRRGVFFLGLFSGCLVVIVGAMLLAIAVAAARKDGGEFSLSTRKVAIVPIDGEIFEARETVETLQRYARSGTVSAIVVRINSPGGAIAPSQEIYAEILKIKRRKPVIASLDSVAASGGFYIAAACDEIVANPGSITGSIGVILQWMNLEDLVRWAKMKPNTIVSGGMKDAGSPYRELTEAERQYLQRIVLQLHAQFVKAVAEGRRGKLTEEEVGKLADGRVFTGEEALALKLVDRLGSLHDAVLVAGRRAGIDGEPSTLYPRRRDATLIDLLTDSSDAHTFIDRFVKGRAARFLYLWEAASVK
jgi:protease-4